jgi:hypothetical protein
MQFARYKNSLPRIFIRFCAKAQQTASSLLRLWIDSSIKYPSAPHLFYENIFISNVSEKFGFCGSL